MGVGFCFGFGLVYHRKIRPTQLWVELSWVVAIAFGLFLFKYYISQKRGGGPNFTKSAYVILEHAQYLIPLFSQFQPFVLQILHNNNKYQEMQQN